MRWLIVLLSLVAGPLRATEVDLELVLAADISRSMRYPDLVVQRRGYAEALTSDAVLGAISRGALGRIAVTYVEWSDTRRQRVLVDWTLIDGRAAAETAAALILRETGGTTRDTSISAGLLFAASRFRHSPFTSYRKVIDISGDGPNNDGMPVHFARDRVVAGGVTINGLPIMAGTADPIWYLPDLDAYYRDCVIGGPGAFALPVFEWENFGAAIRRKMVLEVAGGAPATGKARIHPAAGYDCLIGERIRDRRRSR